MKKGTITKRVLSAVIGCVLAVMPVLTADASNDKVVLGAKEYAVDLDNASRIFLGNKKAMDISEGEAVFLTYTVESIDVKVEKEAPVLQGIVWTEECDAVYPYSDGKGALEFKRDTALFLLQEGYTYFVKFQKTEFGYQYVIAYANGKDEGYIYLSNKEGKQPKDVKYAGLWIDEASFSGRLVNVRCYDKNGKDLGVVTNSAQLKNGATVYDPSKNMKPNKTIKNSYEFELVDATNVAISNRNASKADVVYMEYTIRNATNNMNQTGVAMTNSPTAKYPHAGNGAYLNFEPIRDNSGSILAISGATYLVRFERVSEGFEALVKYTVHGKTKYVTFTQKWGAYNENYKYFTLWFGESDDCKLTAKFTNFKCYDEDGNNLAVQTNQNVEIIRYGGLEDYSECEGVYYCLENDTFISLSDEQEMTKRVDGEASAVTGTYLIDGLVLTMKADSEETYSYYYTYIKDAEGNKYMRLTESEVQFIAGETKDTQIATVETNFKVEKPKTPSLRNYTFKGWYCGDGTEYDFEQVVMGATTLYAKWVDGDGNEYLAVDGEIPSINLTPIIAIASSVLLVMLTVVGVILIMKGGKKDEKNTI